MVVRRRRLPSVVLCVFLLSPLWLCDWISKNARLAEDGLLNSGSAGSSVSRQSGATGYEVLFVIEKQG